MNKLNSLTNRLIALTLSVVMVLSMVPSGIVFAEDTGYGAVTAYTEGVVIDNADPANVVASYTGELEWVAANPSVGRNQDGWWVGLMVTAPEGVDVATLRNATYKSGDVGDKSFWAAKDSEDEDAVHYIGLWLLVDEQIVKDNVNDGKATYTWKFNWDGSEETDDTQYEQTVTLEIDTYNIVLNKEGTQVLPVVPDQFATFAPLDPGVTVTNDGTAAVTASVADVTLAWHPADPDIGRNQDGWWVGLQVNAPADVSVDANFRRGGVTKKFWVCKDSADDAAAHFMKFWVSVSAEMDPYTYSFDWNGDGQFEQTFTLSLGDVTFEKDGVQVFPELGEAVIATGTGTVAGNKTGKVEAVITDVTLEWSEIDTSIGRNQQTWWAGFHLYAPAGFSADATYRSKGSPTGEYGAAKSFATYKDGENYIGVWMPLTEESLNKFKSEGRMLTLWYQFDWDADGTYEQEFAVSVDPTGTIGLNKKDQTEFAFAEPAPGTVWGGATFSNPASGGKTAGTVTYSVVSGNAAVDATGTVTFNGVGAVTIRATMPGDDFYNEAVIEYTVTAVKTAQTTPAFNKMSDTVTYNDNGNIYNAATASGGESSGVMVYSIASGADVADIDSATGVLTIKKAGTVVVKAYQVGDDLYLDSEETTFTLVVNKDNQTTPTFNKTDDTVTYNDNGNIYNAATASGGESTGAMVYSIVSGTDVADIDTATGELTIKKAGTVVVQAYQVGDDRYLDSAVTTFTLVVNKDEQTAPTFNKANDNVTYNDNGNVYNAATAMGGESTGAMVYSIASGADVADIDTATGVMTIKKSGTVVVKAYQEGDDWYLDSAAATFTLVVNKDEQTTPTFNKADDTVTYNDNGNIYNAVTATGGESSGAMIYSIASGADVADIDTATGVLTIKKSGTVVVKAYRPGDDRYLDSAVTTFTLVVNKDEQTTPTFNKANDTVTYNDNGNVYDAATATGGESSGAMVYSIVSGADVADIDTATGELTIKKAGTVVVKAYKVGDDRYLDSAEATFTLVVNKDEQTTPTFNKANDTVTYNDNGNIYNAGTAAGGESTGAMVYSIASGADVADVDTATGKLSIKKAGTVVVKAYRPGDDRYLDSAEATFTLVVNKDEQTTPTFNKANDTVTYNDNGNVYNAAAATGGESSGAMVYSIASGADVADIDTATGELTVKKSGTVVVKAYRPGDDRYLDSAEATFTLVVNKANQSFSFDHTDSVTILYGQTHQTAITPSEKNSGKVSYAITGANTIGAAVDADGLITFTDSADKVGQITVTVTLEGDDCYNPCPASYTLTVEYEAAPANPYALTGDKINTSGWFTGDVTVTPNADYEISYSNALSTQWKETLTWNKEGQDSTFGGTNVIYLRNKTTGGITDAIRMTDLKLDKSLPTDLSISYTTPVVRNIISKIFGFSKESVKVKVDAADAFSGIVKLEYSIDNGATYTEITDKTFFVDAQNRGQLWLRVTDVAGHVQQYKHADEETEKILVVDSITPKINVAYDTTSFPYNNKSVKATITVDEANFFETDGVHELMIKVTKTDDNGIVTVTEYLTEGAAQLVDGAKAETITWTESSGKYTTGITFADDGDYVLEVKYTDLSGNASDIAGTDGVTGSASYASKTITVDKTAPVVEVTYDENPALNGNYFKTDRVATVKVTEHNFNAADFIASVTAKNILNKDVTISDFAALAADDDNWKHEGNVHTLVLTFSTDAAYTFDVAYTDLAGNAAADYAGAAFVVDHTPADNIQITYSAPVLQKIIETLTFGFYKADMVVTVTAKDQTSGVDYFLLTYTRDADATDAHMESFTEKLPATGNKDTFTASYKLDANARGSFSVQVVDKAGKESSKGDAASMIVTDTVAPGISVSFAGKDAATTAQLLSSTGAVVATLDQAASAYYNGNALATITVNEANFFEGKASGNEIIHELLIKVTKTDDNGVVTVTEYLTKGAAQLVAGAAAKEITWTTEGDVHTTAIELAEDGDYVLEIGYADFSGNNAAISGNDGVSGAKSYVSKTITVDKTAPVISVAYGNTAVVNSIGGRNYFNKAQSAVVTVTEHNFRASDVAVSVLAQDVVGNNVAVADFASQLADEKNWTHNGNVHTANISYTVDANYTFDISMKDLANNSSADYAADLFTVDTTAPTGLTVTYSTNVFQEILQSVTFGYYNAKMTVTITADDATTPIHHFAYSYINSQGVSTVNAQLLDQAIQAAEITYNGGKATASFQIPKMVLGYDNQFNGTVQFTAYDRSENNTELKDTTRIVVDNISPTATITYNEAVKVEGDISYYDGNINATIVIREANFRAADVRVVVTKDGEEYETKVNWVDDSVDQHTGTFTLTEDGDYQITVNYADKSGNKMNQYASKQLTLDTTAPEIHVSDIKANSANKDEKYGFTITVSDINLNAETIKPELTAVVRNEDGAYETVTLDLGDMTVVEEGKTYTYTVENLDADALYTLTCQTADQAGNPMKQVKLDDGKLYELVQFSINRLGSTFGYGTAFTEELPNRYYTYSVDQDLVVFEINVDPIENYTVTLNGRTLTEGTDYTTEQTSEPGQWSKRTYTISKALLTEEGEYSIIVSSTDKAETTVFSDVENLKLSFVVDQTAPAITIAGLAAGGRYQIETQEVTLIPSDEGGKLQMLKVVILDADGNPIVDENGKDISVRFDLAGEELLKHLEDNDGKVVFTIPQGLNSTVQIICNDCAANADALTNEYNELFEKVTVSQNALVIFYANTPLFIGVIGGIAAIIAAVIVFLKKAKKSGKTKTKA